MRFVLKSSETPSILIERKTMERLFCPRCQEVFGHRDHFCHKCGFRKGKPFSRKQWWSIALLTNLLIVLLDALLGLSCVGLFILIMVFVIVASPDTCYVEYNSWQRQFILVTTPANRPGRSRKRHPLADIRIDRACS